MKRNRRGRDHSVFICYECGRARCRDGSKLVAGRLYCRECWLSEIRRDRYAINPTPVLLLIVALVVLLMVYGFALGLFVI